MGVPAAKREISEQAAAAVLALAGIPAGADTRVVPVQSGNTVVEVTSGGESFFLKIPTKDLEEWLDPFEGAAHRVLVEQAAFMFLRARGIASVDVIAFQTDISNPLASPYLLTRRVRGEDFTAVVRMGSRRGWEGPLRAVGAFLHNVHAITFDVPGPIVSAEGPAPLEASESGNSLDERHLPAVENLESARARLSPSLFGEVEQELRRLRPLALPENACPRFRLGGFHPNHVYLVREEGEWSVSACIDLDGACAGDVTDDLMTFAAGMMFRFDSDIAWWEPLFEGYGAEWSFERTRLELLGTCAYWFRELGDLSGTYRRLLSAGSWSELFNAHRSC